MSAKNLPLLVVAGICGWVVSAALSSELSIKELALAVVGIAVALSLRIIRH